MKSNKMKLAVVFILILTALAFGQRQPDPNVGQLKYTRQGIMDGNLVRTIFWNHGEIADWPHQPSGEWPKGSGHSYVDGVALVVATPIVDATGKRRHSVMTRYREDMDVSPEQIPWGFAPLPGYFNENPKTNTTNSPAMSNDPRTWPLRWPDRPPDWAGLWNGFFGKGVTNADLEAYIVFDDDPDEEFLFYPDPTDSSRRGLGLEVAARLFQWNQVLAQDVIFAIYFITNEGKKDYDSTYFAFHIDWGIGGTDDSADDGGNYDEDLDIAWAFDGNGYGSPGNWSPVGVGGFAFLESPGIFRDGRDNDNDGLLNERRDSGPGTFLTQYPYGVTNVAAFQKFYPEHPLRPHWSGDENIDWDPFEDLNQNGVWDNGEPLRDDVGADGLGPFDPNYPGPDFGEADGIPTAGEPDFDFTDKDESDQIGLTGFNVFVLHEYKMENDEAYWNGLRAALPPRDKLVQNTNLGMFFASGPFELKAGDTQFYSMALLFAEDQQDLARTKKTVQQIYNADYRFAKPPDKPTLRAIAGDGKVILYWDDKAEKSWDPFLQEFDFEGYNIYRATDAEFLEIQTITDSYGKKRFREPIAKFDLKNGIKGLHPIDVEGIKFNLGDDTGLQHFYIDRNVKNGQTYYYAVVPYDHGLVDTTATGEISGITPSEAPSVIKVSIAGVVEKTDINTAIVTPQAPAAGYIDPQIDGEIVHHGPATGTLEVQMLDPQRIRNGHTYRITFHDTSAFAIDPEPKYSLINVTTGDTLVTRAKIAEGKATTPVTEGFVSFLFNDVQVQVLEAETGWLVGSSNYRVRVAPNRSLIGRFVSYPADFELRFYDSIVDTSESLLFGQKRIPTNFKIWNLTEDRQMDFIFGDRDNDGQFTPGDSVTIVTGLALGRRPQGSRFKAAWAIFFDSPGNETPKPPKPGDIYRIVVSKPFREGEFYEFKVRGARVDVQKAKNSLDNIAVVPNPYVGAASWEPRNPFQFGRGERRIYFINLPAKCTIRIYTIRGYLVKTLEHDAPADNGAEAWDLISKDGMNIAYGVYVYHIDAPEIGTHIGKFAVIK
ncbi:MAG: hypothetical protein ONB42_21325 [candidate division KSB1 bacterium]|nr:hypothetical protein [candidate division KSB1 bacterium]MDZ7313934.1 hypothetical protein [candidate division KSB1 bacterium]